MFTFVVYVEKYQNALLFCSPVFYCSIFLLQVAGRYRVMVESSMASSDDIIFNCGDVIQLLHEELSGIW